MTLTQNALLDAIRQEMRKVPSRTDAITGAELAERLGVHGGRACKMIRKMLATGEATAVKIQKPDITGRLQTHTGFRLKK